MEAIKEIEAKLEAAVGEVKTEVDEVVAPLFPEAKKLTIELEAAEKLSVRELEVQYLRAMADAQRIGTAMESLKARYGALLKDLTTKYVKDADYVWDELTAGFKLVVNKL